MNPDRTVLYDDRCNVRGFALLHELSCNLRWSWNHASDILWQQLDPALWKLTHNPWIVFQTVSREKLEKLLADPTFHELAKKLVEETRENKKRLGWFGENHPNSPLNCVAYFSMEFMLADALPIYSGGLGNVAGDQLKAASDLAVPVVGIGLLYQQGYFRQVLDSQGAQQALYPYNDPGQLPITPLRKGDGEWLRLELALPGYSMWLRTWQVQVGRVKLFLLDTNDAANLPAHRAITSELYGGGPELRLQQELVLGIGGWRLLEALNLCPTVCHLNEGHAAFVILERAKSFMQTYDVSFEVALKTIRAGNLFTTHTAVPAGFDRFSRALMETYLSKYAQNALGISLKELMALGRENPLDPSEPFNMAFLALRGSAFCNGVSALHGKVSRQLFSPLFPRWPESEIPIGHVTNGVHMPSWDSPAADSLWSTACGKNRWLETKETVGKDLSSISTAALWGMRVNSRERLIEFVRERLRLQCAIAGETDQEEKVKKLFDPQWLTLGFARRFATYKRPNLLLHDPERLIRILTNPKCPVQLFIAGKAHPADLQGQALIQEWSHFIKRPEVHGHVAFLSDYDMYLSEQLVQGVDVWINTPLRPWEACGTSGMKVLVNGCLNLSVQDGWWEEAYTPEVGWAIGSPQVEGKLEGQARNAADAEALYTLLENQIVPQFYSRNSDDIPEAWVKKIRVSMSTLTPQYSANRAVRQYTEKYYLPAADLYYSRVNACKIKTALEVFEENWKKLQFKGIDIETTSQGYNFRVKVALHHLDPDAIKVQLYADIAAETPLIYTMTEKQKLPGDEKIYLYALEVPSTYPASFYTARILPNMTPTDATSLELPYILWER